MHPYRQPEISVLQDCPLLPLCQSPNADDMTYRDGDWDLST